MCSGRGAPHTLKSRQLDSSLEWGGAVLVLGAGSAVGLPCGIHRSRGPWAGAGHAVSLWFPSAPGSRELVPLPPQTLLALSTNQQGFFPLTQRVVPLRPLLGHKGLCHCPAPRGGHRGAEGAAGHGVAPEARPRLREAPVSQMQGGGSWVVLSKVGLSQGTGAPAGAVLGGHPGHHPGPSQSMPGAPLEGEQPKMSPDITNIPWGSESLPSALGETPWGRRLHCLPGEPPHGSVSV